MDLVITGYCNRITDKEEATDTPTPSFRVEQKNRQGCGQRRRQVWYERKNYIKRFSELEFD